MTNPSDQGIQTGNTAKSDRSRPVKPLPTDRLSIETQFAVLRGYAATSGAEHRAVSNDEVGKTIGMNSNSISLCNPFWESIGLITREGRKQRPTDAVFEYFQAYQWNQDTAASKLAPILSSAWFHAVLAPKLSFRSLSKIEAAGFLADETKASRNYQDNLFLILEYMRQVGIVSIDGDTISLIQPMQEKQNKAEDEHPPQQPSDNATTDIETRPSGMKRFAVHIPDKNDAVFLLPENIDQEDWEMALEVIQMYVSRWKKFQGQKGSA